jgi:hypothetical protein
MTDRTVFFQNYILSLKERTRNEKSGIQIGFDWIIYNLALAKNWTPTNLPFFRSAHAKDFVTKTGAQLGIDMAFIYKKELIIFVLKDEKLNNRNWIKHNFDSDMRMAVTPDLSINMGHKISKVRVILAYNKDEDDTGLKLYNNLIASFPTTMGENIGLKFERWNITEIVHLVNNLLITPDLLPQHLSSLLGYICDQVKDFDYGSEAWEKILVPSWKKFLNILLSEKIDERRLRMIPVCLLIIYNNKNDKPAFSAGWIDLIEWAMLAIWDKYCELDNALKRIILVELWNTFYLVELEKYILINEPSFIVEHGMVSKVGVGQLTPLNDSYLIYWIIGRIGILHLGFHELKPQEEITSDENISKLVSRSFDWIYNILRNNPAAYRPLIDLNHIELYIIWMIIYETNNKEFMKIWLSELERRLVIRRMGNYKIPFIEGGNRYDLVAEYAATFSSLQQKPNEFVDTSSYLLLMLLEIIFSLVESERDILLHKYYKHLVQGIGDDENPLSDPPYKIDLQSWVPPVDWSKRIYSGRVFDGIAYSLPNIDINNASSLTDIVKSVVTNMEKQFSREMELPNPLSSYILACIKNKSPLPPAFWRGTIFTDLFDEKRIRNI